MEKEFLQLFLSTPVPEEPEAEDRAWSMVSAAYAEREPVRRPVRLSPALAFAAAAAAVVVAVVTPVGGWISERIEGQRPAQPALVRLPAAGRLLVVSEQGPWVVSQDGSKRRLGDYDDASWSPRGLYVVVAGGRRLAAVEPGDGSVHWSLSRPRPIRDPRWAGVGLDTRIAYRTGDELRVVAGDGAPDRLVARQVAAVAPAWRPGDAHVLAYADGGGVVHVVDTDSGRELSRLAAGTGVRELLWSDRVLLVFTRTGMRQYLGRRDLGKPLGLPSGQVVLDAAVSPDGGLAYTDYDPDANTTTLLRSKCSGAAGSCLVAGPESVFRAPGRLEEVAWSPSGRWLLAAWPEADQLLFFRFPGARRPVAVSGITLEFDPGGEGLGGFPRVAGWCCPP
jgi:hypothetical protein